MQACDVVASRYSGAGSLLWACCLHYKFLHAIKVLASVHVFDNEGKQDTFCVVRIEKCICADMVSIKQMYVSKAVLGS